MNTNKHNSITIIFSMLVILGLSACDHEKDGATSPKNIIGVGPIANAGVDKTVISGSKIILDGGESTDPDAPDDELLYMWDLGSLGQKTGEVVEGEIPSSVPIGIYTVTLSVTDAEGNVDTDTMIITVEAPPPPPPKPVTPAVVDDTEPVTTPIVDDPEPVNEPVPIVNVAPVAENLQQVSASCSSIPLTITLVASDSDGDTLIYRIVSQPTSGNVSLSGNVATYTNNTVNLCTIDGTDLPVMGDSFSFVANDGTVDSNVGVISIDYGAQL